MSQLKFSEISEHVTQLKSDWGKRDEAIDEIEKIFLLDWGEEETITGKVTNALVTKSPDGRNQALGAVRLMTGANPTWAVPEKMNTDDVMEQAGEISSVSDRLWRAASRVAGDPIHYDEVLSLILWSEAHIIIDRTEDLVNAAAGVSAAAEARANEIANRSPIAFHIKHPKTGYPELDKYGMSAYYSEAEMTKKDFINEVGEAKAKELFAAGGITYKDFMSKITPCKYLDYRDQYLWFGNKGAAPAFAEVKAHGFPTVPIVYTRGEGSSLFEKPHHQNQSFLYTMYHSGFWNRSNLVLTVAYTLVLALGSAPMFKETLNKDDEGVKMKQIGAARKAVVPYGADYDLMNMNNLLNKDLLGLLELAERKISESTMYSQTLGEPLGKSAPFSMVALLHQAGRLPLVSTQRKGSWGTADAMKKALAWMKAEKPTIDYPHIFGKTQTEFLNNLPDYYELTAKLGLDLPEDLSENVRNAKAMRDDTGNGPLMSDQWIRENIMKESDPNQMQKDIWSEQTGHKKNEEYIMQQIYQIVREEVEAEIMAAMEEQAMEEGGGGGDMPVDPNAMPVDPNMQALPEEAPGMPTQVMSEGAGTEPQQPIPPMAPKG